MEREFNDTGTCIPELHFMADISAKLDAIFALIEKGQYFTINRPRQYGKTTIQYMLWRKLREKADYGVIRLSFESVGSDDYTSAAHFTEKLINLLKKSAQASSYEKLSILLERVPKSANFTDLDRLITDLTSTKIRVVLLIDEVDKNSNNQLFLDFLALLRSKYLNQREGVDSTFHSVILAGVHDIKNLKFKLRTSEEQKYNSPWNIAADFNVDLSLQTDEIASMLKDYATERGVSMDPQAIAERLFHHTSGYPFLVSRLCKTIDETMDVQGPWTPEIIDQALSILLRKENTNFKSLIQNLENNPDLYALTEKLLLEGISMEFTPSNSVIQKGLLYGVFQRTTSLKIHNRVYEQYIYNHLSANLRIEKLSNTDISAYTIQENYLNKDGNLNLESLLLKFRDFMQKEYSKKKDWTS